MFNRLIEDALKAIPEPQGGGLPSYSYDPQSQQYTQVPSQFKAPQPNSDSESHGYLADLLRQLKVPKSEQDMVHQYSYDPASQQYTRLKTGGIARAEAAGRHGDDRLVHMSSAELEALRALARRHGKDLTINPETGLPEAFKLKDILPAAATAAALFFAPEIAAFGGGIGQALGLEGALAQGVGMGLLSGGVTTALTGDVKKGLTTGLVSGLTAGALYSPTAPSTPSMPTSNVQTPLPAASAMANPITPSEIPQFPSIQPPASVAPPPPTAPTDVGFTQTKPSFFEASGTPTIGQTVGAAGPSTPVDLGTSQPGLFPMSSAPPSPTGLGSQFMNWWSTLSGKEQAMYGGSALAAAAMLAPKPKLKSPPIDKGTIRPYTYTRTQAPGAYPSGPTYGPSGLPNLDTRERVYFNDYYTALPTYKAAAGGFVPPTGPVEEMSQNIVGAGGMYPQSQMERTNFATPTQMPTSAEVVASDYDTKTNPFTGMELTKMAGGGLPPLGGYSDGGRLLKGPGDGVSDDIPATIANKQPARLADGEFVIPARIVSELGNGSTDAGAKRLYAMMDRVQNARRKSAKKGKFAIDSKAEKYLPA